MYGIPKKMIKISRDMYDGFQYAVMDDEETSEWFDIKTGVKQGCLMSGFLFLLVIDWSHEKSDGQQKNGHKMDVY